MVKAARNLDRLELAKLRELTRAEVTKRFRKAKAEGDLPENAHPEGLAQYILVVEWLSRLSLARLERISIALR